MRITYTSPSLTVDLDVTVVEPSVPVGELIRVLTGRDPGRTALVDGAAVRTDEAIGSLPIHNGSTIGSVDGDAAGPVDEHGPLRPPAATLTRIAGPDSATSMVLPDGVYDIGPGQPGEEIDPVVRVHVLADGPRVQRIGADPVLVDGRPLDAGSPIVGEIIEFDDVAVRLSDRPPPRPVPLPLTDGGRVPYQRPPRQLGTPEPEPPPKPPAPAEPRPAQPFSWIVAVAPLPIGIVAAIFFSPFFLVFLLMTPILTVGRWYESRRRSSRDRRRHDEELDGLVATYAADLQRWIAEIERLRRGRQPDAVRLTEIAMGADPGLWERRPDHDDFLRLGVGIHAEPLTLASGEIDRCAEVDEELGWLRSVPATVDLAAEAAIGIVGDRSRARRLATAMLTELTVVHGPSDVSLVLLIDPDRHLAWDWAKWLPHLDGPHGRRRLATDPSTASALLSSLPRPPVARGVAPSPVAPVPVVVVDGDRFLDGSFVALSTAVRADAARTIVLADSPVELPAICATIIDVGSAGRATISSMRDGSRQPGVLPTLLEPEQAAGLVRRLSAYADPDRIDEAADLPSDCDLRSLIGGAIEVDELVGRWTTASPTPRATIGVTVDGGLVVDLVSDGPHALVAGTTGSGKSELLRTLIAGLAVEQGPDRINFVLIDFKGGGAFDACTDLPHTVGVVTDLDEHLASRALRCLKAELTHRETVLRNAGVSDLRDLPAGGVPLPRLVVVVDEFATLAAELPDFMASLVDIAQRGRSLGLHMVLATQRPAGVVDAKIRANTNLRICLRVQDRHDSDDVIGDPRAAAIDRRTPGRGHARFGAAELVQFQAALVSRTATAASTTPIRMDPFELATEEPLPEPNGGAGSAWSVGPPGSAETSGSSADHRVSVNGHHEPGRTDLGRLAVAARGAARTLGLAAPRVPWPQPVPPDIDAATLGSTEGVVAWSAPLGVVDLPDQQRTEEYWWTPEVGNLLVYGSDPSSTTSTLATLTIGLGRFGSRPRPHVYVIDFSGGGALSGLARLAHVGGVVTAVDDERLLRTVDLVEAEMTRRAERARTLGSARLGATSGESMVLLAIANYGGLAGFLDETGNYEVGGRLERIVRDGPSLGVFVVATANHDRAVPSRLASQVDARLVMRLADPNAYTAFGLRAREVPHLGPGRAIDTRTGHEVQIARYRSIVEPVGGVDRPGDEPIGIETLGSDLPPEPLLARSTSTRAGLRLVLGLRHRDLSPATVELRPGVDLVVAGPAGSGKTTALRAVVGAVHRAVGRCRVVVRTDDPDRWSGFDDELGPLDGADAGPTLVVIDGIGAVTDDFARRLADGRHDRLWVAIADRPERLHLGPAWLRVHTAARTGLLLQPQPDHGDLFRVRLPTRSTRMLPAGRGYLVDAGVPDLVQVANAGDSTATGSVPPPSPDPTSVPPAAAGATAGEIIREPIPSTGP